MNNIVMNAALPYQFYYRIYCPLAARENRSLVTNGLQERPTLNIKARVLRTALSRRIGKSAFDIISSI